MCATILLSLHRDGPLRPLHSFPTRRSSDLAFLMTGSPALMTSVHPSGEVMRRRARVPRFLCWVQMRSEEHTSELQSRGHLVCRLLLEKKKKTQSGARDFRCANRGRRLTAHD